LYLVLKTSAMVIPASAISATNSLSMDLIQS
jgi:hypothetical protein